MPLQRAVTSRLVVLAAVLFATLAGSARADDERRGIGPTLAIDTGFSTGGSGTGVLLGGSVRFDVGDRLGIELAGHFLDRGRGENAGDGLASVLVNLRPSAEKVVPYLAVGGGIYHGRGRTYAIGPYTTDGRGGWTMTPQMTELMRQFMGGWYGGRGLESGYQPWNFDQIIYPRRDSTDPALTIGGGIRIDLGHQLSLTPDARGLIVFSDGDTRSLGTLTVSLGYRF